MTTETMTPERIKEMRDHANGLLLGPMIGRDEFISLCDYALEVTRERDEAEQLHAGALIE